MKDYSNYETSRRLLERAELSVRTALSAHEYGEHVGLIRADLLQARELIDLVLRELEEKWAAAKEMPIANEESCSGGRERIEVNGSNDRR